MKKFLGIAISAIILALVAVIILQNYGVIKSNTTLYTKDQIDQAYKDGFADGCESEENYKNQIASLKNQLEEKINALAIAQAEAGKVPGLETKISELEKEISDLKAIILYYQELLSIEKPEEIVTVTFYFNNQVYSSIVTGKNSVLPYTPDYEQIEKEGYRFFGWIDSNNNELDLTTQVFEQNTSLYANVEENFSNKEAVVFASPTNSWLWLKSEEVVVLISIDSRDDIESRLYLCQDGKITNEYSEEHFKGILQDVNFEKFSINVEDLNLYKNLAKYLSSNIDKEFEFIDLVEFDILIPDSRVGYVQVQYFEDASDMTILNYYIQNYS